MDARLTICERRPPINCPICHTELVHGGGAYKRKSDGAAVSRRRCVVCRVNFSDAPPAHGGRPRSETTVVFTDAQTPITMGE